MIHSPIESDEPEQTTALAHPEPVEGPEFTPVPRERMRRGGWSAERQRRFIELLAETGSVRAACRRMGVGEHHIYKLRRHPEAASFRKAWEAALDCGVARLEDVAMDRALNGVDQPLVHKGEVIGQRKVYNDRLLMFLLQNRAHERFASGGRRGPDAIDRMELARHKKRWRAEWEAEKQEEDLQDEEKVRAGLDQFLENMRQRRLAAMTPRTRALEEDLARAHAEDLDAYDAREAHPLLPGLPWPRLSGPDDQPVEDGEWEDAE